LAGKGKDSEVEQSTGKWQKKSSVMDVEAQFSQICEYYIFKMPLIM
jgi:hypothetical protein